jgi:hypothetical protein
LRNLPLDVHGVNFTIAQHAGTTNAEEGEAQLLKARMYPDSPITASDIPLCKDCEVLNSDPTYRHPHLIAAPAAKDERRDNTLFGKDLWCESCHASWTPARILIRHGINFE